MKRLAALMLLAVPTWASTLFFTGTFAQDDEVAVFGVSIIAGQTLTIRTFGFAGGVNSASQVIAGGGFDPVISVFDANAPTTPLLAVNDDDTPACAHVGTDAATHACWDSYLGLTGLSGTYYVVLSQSGNNAGATLLDPFTQAGQGNYTGPLYLGQPGSFIAADLSHRTGNWAVEISDVGSVSQIPEPSTVLLSGGILVAGMVWSRLRTA